VDVVVGPWLAMRMGRSVPVLTARISTFADLSACCQVSSSNWGSMWVMKLAHSADWESPVHSWTKTLDQRLNLRDYLARPKQHSSGDGSSSLSSSPLLSFSRPLHTSPQQACWSMLPKSACRRSPPRSLLLRSSLKHNRNIRHWAYPTVFLRIFVGFLCTTLVDFGVLCESYSGKFDVKHWYIILSTYTYIYLPNLLVSYSVVLKIFQQSEEFCSIIHRISHKPLQKLVFCPISPLWIWYEELPLSSPDSCSKNRKLFPNYQKCIILCLCAP